MLQLSIRFLNKSAIIGLLMLLCVLVIAIAYYSP
ncbi:hypothetical protein J2Z69_003025 [Paenibacillus shirakamiensis]|uniref:ABC transporter permease n=1 Tax=Paenibacillus shirakamiensis TaxID=1265935 RepID=A0ABS4JJT3_9BACL|nr:hypothetical protein [Paenibacillus shirakamiensis]